MTPVRYQICIKGHLDEGWSHRLDGMEIVNRFDVDKQPITVITGPVIDQAALYGLLCRLRDMGVSLISVEPQVQFQSDADVNPPGQQESDNHNL